MRDTAAAVRRLLRNRALIPTARWLALAVEARSPYNTIFERVVGRPTLQEFSQLGLLTLDVDEFLTTLLGDVWAERRTTIVTEYEQVRKEIAARADSVDLRYPAHFTVEDGTALVLYAIVRVTAPTVVIETGVADGRSTATMLAAMNRSGAGLLHSIDIASDVGALVGDRSRWKLHVVDPNASLGPTLEAAGPADIFVHDADHSRSGQQRDATAAQVALKSRGLYLSDDAEWSYVFFDTARVLGDRPVFLVDARKVFGAVRLGSVVAS